MKTGDREYRRQGGNGKTRNIKGLNKTNRQQGS